MLAKSDTYQSRFFRSCSRYRYIELQLQALTGRAPDNFADASAGSCTILGRNLDFKADHRQFYQIASNIQNRFGEDTRSLSARWQNRRWQEVMRIHRCFPAQTRGASSSDLQGEGRRWHCSQARQLPLTRTPVSPVISPRQLRHSSFRLGFSEWHRQTRSGVGPPRRESVFRSSGQVAIKSEQSSKVSRLPANQAGCFTFPFEKTRPEQYQRIHAEGGENSQHYTVNIFKSLGV